MSNPFDAPEQYGAAAARPGGVRTFKLKRVGILSVALFGAAAGAAMGLLAGLMMVLFSGFAAAIGQGAGGPNAAQLVGTGLGMLIMAPLLYGVFGFFGGLINAILYNLVAGMTGGIEIDLEAA